MMNVHTSNGFSSEKEELFNDFYANLTNLTVKPYQLEEHLAKAIRKEDHPKWLVLFISEIYVVMKGKVFENAMPFCPHVLDFAQKSYAESNARNLLSIIEIIHANEEKLLPQSANDVDTHCEEFKKICRTPIYMTDGAGAGLYSGVYALFVYYKHYSNEPPRIQFQWHYGLQKSVSEDERKMDPTYYHQERAKLKRKIFFDNSNSYISKFEKELALSLHLPRNQKGALWKLFDLYGYAAHDIVEEERGQDIFKMFRDGESNHIFSLLSQGSVNALPGKYEGVLLFVTVLRQKMSETDRTEMRELVTTLQKINMGTFILSDGIPAHYQKLVKSDQSAGVLFAEKYHELRKDYIAWLEGKIISPCEDKFDEERISLPIAETTEENLYKIVLWRMLIVACRYRIDVLRNALLFTPESFDRGERLRLYLASQPTEAIGVSTWDEFRKKYHHQLDVFFPDVQEGILQKSWMYSMVALLCYFYDIAGYPRNSLQFPKVISESSLKNYSDDIASFTSDLVFIMLHISMYSKDDVIAEMKGKDTVFFHGLTEKLNEKKSRMKPLPDLIRFFKTQYTSGQKPNDYGLLSLHLARWISGQTEGFLLTGDERDLFNRLRKCLWSAFEHVVCATSPERCREEADLFCAWLKDVLHDAVEKNKKIDSSKPDAQPYHKHQGNTTESRTDHDSSREQDNAVFSEIQDLFEGTTYLSYINKAHRE